MTLDFFIWDINPEILSIGNIPIRWYGLLFVGGFILSPPLAKYILSRDIDHQRANDIVDRALIYIMIATVIGARLGHVIFYDPMYFLQNPLETLLPISFHPKFHISGFKGLASHGAAITIPISLILFLGYDIKVGLFPPRFSIKKKPKKLFPILYSLDIVVILVALGGFFIRTGNFMNSELYGKPTNAITATFFANDLKRSLKDKFTYIDDIKFSKRTEEVPKNSTVVPLNINISLRNKFDNEFKLKQLIEYGLHYFLGSSIYGRKLLSHNFNKKIDYTISEKGGKQIINIKTYGITRHPSPLYEALSCIILFAILLWFRLSKFYYKFNQGYITGFFFIWIFGLRFIYEFYKESQQLYEGSGAITVPHALSVVAVIFGILLMVFSKKNTRITD